MRDVEKTGADAVVFDASAVLAFLKLERGSRSVKAELMACRAGRKAGWVSPATLGEIRRALRRHLDPGSARRAVDLLLLTPLAIAPFDRDLAELAADWSHETGVDLFDSIVAATTLRLSAAVLTADSDFKRFESRIRVAWIR